MSAHPPLQLARLEYTDSGLPHSSAFDDVYHSRAGGLEQARAVFLAGNQLPARWAGTQLFTILETGFGLGLSFLATWQAWRQDPQRGRHLHFISVEKHPFSRSDVQQLHQGWPELAELAARLQDRWPLLTAGFHRLQLDSDVTLTLILGDAHDWLPQLDAEVDAFYLDGFAPAKNPELWNDALFRQIARLAHPHATAATYTVAAAVRHGLQSAGFAPEKWPGFGGKRDMLHARYQRPRPERRRLPAHRHALIIGAGLAGSTIALQLARRGWRTTVLERASAPAQGASGNRVGVLHPVLSLDDNLQARLSRACSEFAWHHLQALAQHPSATFAWGRSGVLQLAADDGQEQHQRRIIEHLQLPPDYARYVTRDEASALCGQAVDCGGWWFAGGGWVEPAALCRTQLDIAGSEVLYGNAVARLAHDEGLWQAYDAADRLLCQAPVLVLANAAEAAELVPGLPLQRLRRQVSHVPATQLPPLDVVLCREGYLTPATGGLACLGASRDDEARGLDVTVAAHQANLQRLSGLLPQWQHTLDPTTLTGRVGFRPTTPDRLPLIGALPDFAAAPRRSTSQLHQLPRLPAAYGLLGFGARGLTWAALGAELLACQIGAEPWPLERELVHAVDPGRFWLRELRKLT